MTWAIVTAIVTVMATLTMLICMMYVRKTTNTTARNLHIGQLCRFIGGKQTVKHLCEEENPYIYSKMHIAEPGATMNGYFASMTPEDRKRRSISHTCTLTQGCPEWRSEDMNRVEHVVSSWKWAQSILHNNHEWKFALSPPKWECDLPHTRGNVVILPQHILSSGTPFFKKVLAHEMVHVLQKQLPHLFMKLYEQWKFTEFDEDALPGQIRQQIRNNPDTLTVPRRWLWNGRYVPLPLYSHTTAANNPKCSLSADYMLWDIVAGHTIPWEKSEMELWFGANATQPEHPNELSATMLAEILVSDDTVAQVSQVSHADIVLHEWYLNTFMNGTKLE